MKEKIITFVKALLIGIFVLIFPIASGIIIAVQKFEAPHTYYIQSLFMLIPILFFVLYMAMKRSSILEFGLNYKIEKINFLFYLPVLLVYIPVMVKGFHVVDTSSFFGMLILYLLVGICEELYYRGINNYILEKKFNVIGVIVISTLIFGFGHMASAFVEENPIMVILNVLNALLFGFMAINLYKVSKTIIPLMLVHFLFDFETKFINLSGNGLMIAEIVRGTIMCVYGIFLFVYILKKQKVKENI